MDKPIFLGLKKAEKFFSSTQHPNFEILDLLLSQTLNYRLAHFKSESSRESTSLLLHIYTVGSIQSSHSLFTSGLRIFFHETLSLLLLQIHLQIELSFFQLMTFLPQHQIKPLNTCPSFSFLKTVPETYSSNKNGLAWLIGCED